MGWEKQIKGEHKQFLYSSIESCKECSGYYSCLGYKIKKKIPCFLIQIYSNPFNLNIVLDSKERSNPKSTRITIDYGKISSKTAWKIVDSLDKAMKELKVPEEIIKEKSKNLFKESFPKQFFNIEYDGFENLNYGFSESPQLPDYIFSNFFSLITKLPIAKEENHPTYEDLGFPFRIVTEKEFLRVYDDFYRNLANFVINNGRSE